MDISELIIETIGWAGGALVVVAYFMISSGKAQGNSYGFQTLNLVGSIFLIINTWYKGAYPSTAVNVIWVGIALMGYYRIYRKGRVKS
jgi:hypothetical protein